MLTLAAFDLLYIVTSMLLFGMPSLYPRYICVHKVQPNPFACYDDFSSYVLFNAAIETLA